MATLTSQYTVQELYELMKETVKNAGNGGIMFLTETDFFDIENGRLQLVHIKEYEGVSHVISRKKIEPYTLYLLVDLFENAIDEHLIRMDK